MAKYFLVTCLYFSFMFADDYSFDFKELEKLDIKTYEYNGYIKGEHKYQNLNKRSLSFPSKNKSNMNSYFGEAFLKYKYFYDKFIFQTELAANYENIDSTKEDTYTANQLFINYKYNENHQLNIGKKTGTWGKGYFFNPIAFVDRKKDPTNPETNKEGYSQVNYKYNKTFQNDLQNITFDAVYIKTTSNFNEDFYDQNSNTIALKTYLLYKDIDIDFAYLYNDKLVNKYGVDFSTNLQTNFEIHGEYAKSDDGLYSYLLGLKYLTEFELTILSEYFYQNEELSKNKSFWDNRYFINKFTQKEPFDILYFSVYYKNSYNLDDNSQQNNVGMIYTKIKNFTIDFSIGKNSGKDTTEFGSKLVDTFTWLQLKYNF